MNREQFDDQLMAYLYDELGAEERSTFEARLETDMDAREVVARFRKTLAAADLPPVEPSAGFEQRILEAMAEVERGEAWHRKLFRTLAWAGSHAMRPQFAMGTLLVLVLGSSLLLLRAKPGAVQVTAEAPAAGLASGEPSAKVAIPPRFEAMPTGGSPSATAERPKLGSGASDAAADPEEAFRRGTKLLEEGRFADARREFAAAAAAGGKDAAKATLFEGRAVRADSGCKAALPWFQQLRDRYGVSGYGADAAFDEALCLRELGDAAAARALLERLTENPEYRKQAKSELARGKRVRSGRGVVESGGGIPASAGAAPAPPPRTDRPTNDQSAY